VTARPVRLDADDCAPADLFDHLANPDTEGTAAMLTIDTLLAAADNSADYTSTKIEYVDAFTQEIRTLTVYGGTARPVVSFAFDVKPNHVTGWSKRNGARTTYAELTCTCRLTGESIAVEDGHAETWISYGSEGWIERLNRRTAEHVLNVIARPYWIRPARGDRSRWGDRTRVDEIGLRNAMQEHGLRYSELSGHVADLRSGLGPLVADDGTRFELAR
jgi:hypothetical protein